MREADYAEAELSTDGDAELLLSPWQQMASSCTGALLVSLFMTPLDVVKIRLQAQEVAFSRKCFLYSNGVMDHLYVRVNGDPPPPVAMHTKEELCNCKWYNRPKYFNGTFDAMHKIGRLEGLTSLWSGLSPTLVLAIPATMLYFTMYEQTKLFVSARMNVDRHDHVVPLTAGPLARAFATTTVSPLELIRTKMQSQKMSFWETKDALRTVLRSEGVFGLWRGCSATLYRDVPFSAIYWTLYEALKLRFQALTPPTHHFEATFLAGALAGSAASTITLPMDVVKTRRQIEMGETEICHVRPGRGPSTLATVKGIVSSEGWTGLFTGLAPRVLKVAPACAIMISSYECGKRFFIQRNSQRASTSTATAESSASWK